MSEAWISFIIVVSIQFVLFIIHAYAENKLREIPKILGWGMLIGVIFGVLFDLVVGKVFGLYWYELGFGMNFLLINGVLSYGFMQANTLLMQRASFIHFYLWSIAIGVIYEVSNSFFRVWNWDFSTPIVELVIVHAVGYIGLAVLMALNWHIFLKHKFVFIENILVKKF